jgi:hypothetical protein
LHVAGSVYAAVLQRPDVIDGVARPSASESQKKQNELPDDEDRIATHVSPSFPLHSPEHKK